MGFSPYIDQQGYEGLLAPEETPSPEGLSRIFFITHVFLLLMQSPALHSRRWRLATLICVFAVCLSSCRANSQTNAVTLTPNVVEVGSPELIHVQSRSGALPEAEWLGRKVQFFPAHGGRDWFALAGVDVEAPTGPSILSIGSGTDSIDLSRTVEIYPAHYRTGTLTVPPKFVEPGPEDLKLIEADSKLKAKVFAASAPEPLWSGNFRAPVTAQPTDSFGTRRIFNGKLASIHKGMDFRAATGTPVHAGNSGVVVLARPLYYEGNCVIVDHGLGLWTISMHLSRIDVKEGQHVVTGELLGLSGATGRVTGPHLHWAVRWQDAYLDPAKLLSLDLSDLR
jgi:murein DD-endopeptidase MepM/ murein hydrolase activator NlpD